LHVGYGKFDLKGTGSFDHKKQHNLLYLNTLIRAVCIHLSLVENLHLTVIVKVFISSDALISIDNMLQS